MHDVPLVWSLPLSRTFFSLPCSAAGVPPPSAQYRLFLGYLFRASPPLRISVKKGGGGILPSQARLPSPPNEGTDETASSSSSSQAGREGGRGDPSDAQRPGLGGFAMPTAAAAAANERTKASQRTSAHAPSLHVRIVGHRGGGGFRPSPSHRVTLRRPLPQSLPPSLPIPG